MQVFTDLEKADSQRILHLQAELTSIDADQDGVDLIQAFMVSQLEMLASLCRVYALEKLS